MYITKKTKIILSTAIPAAAVVTASAIALPIVLTNEKSIFNTLDNAENFQPIIKNEKELNELFLNNVISYNPTLFSKKFFINKIANNEEVLQKIFRFPGSNNENVVNGVQYTIVSVSENSKNEIVATVEKSYKGKTKLYETIANFSNFNFVDNEEQSKKNFLYTSAQNFKSLFNQNNGKPNANVAINGATDLNIDSIKKEQMSFTSNSDSISFIKSPSDSFIVTTNDNMFEYESTNIKFEFDVMNGNGIWSASDAFPVNANGKFDKDNSKTYQFLQSIKDNLALPNLTEEESNGLDEEQINEKRIEKFIFNPLFDPYFDNKTNNTKIPQSNYNAILIKMTYSSSQSSKTSEIVSYTMIWQNLALSLEQDIISSAKEIDYGVKKGVSASQIPTASQIKNNPSLWLVPSSNSLPAGLKYEPIKVEIPTENNEDQTKVIVTIEVSNPSKPELGSKVYKKTIEKGIKGIKQATLDDEINKVLNSNISNLSPLMPTCTLTGITGSADEIAIKLNDLIDKQAEWDKYVTLKKQSNTDKIAFVPQLVSPGIDKILIMYKVVSAEDQKIQSSIVPVIIVEIMV